MGRYITGDIKTKLWFGVQASDDADFFGVCGEQPEELYYYYETVNLPEIKEGIKECEKTLGEFKEKFDTFFKDNNTYNDKQLAKYLKLTEKDMRQYLTWYARLELGQMILDCVLKNDYCEFTAEL